ncbi:XkdQ/YqbQ family protein [Cohnella nanjingensis]|uniref:Phage portal protein n=1 Tax=Cohnella nanjingensis TaxID=1387779 RepID=A0A7X0RSR4_9BACL|nr:phage portal protein [Cohnella nanjingensis]MBB6673023.1 phage portal protein [Cohnella nanjingensis]
MSYQVMLAGKYQLDDLVESLSLEEALDEVAYRATIKLLVTPDLPQLAPGQSIEIKGTPTDGTDIVTILSGVIWECESTSANSKHLQLIAYDKMIYLAKSDDERLMTAGQTAAQRLKSYAKDWQIPLGNIVDTKIPLARDVKRTKSIWAMIQEDLKETADKGGGMFRPRMTPTGVDLLQLGSNKTVWDLDILQEIGQRRTLEGAVTQVKVLGTQAPKAKTAPAEVDTSKMTMEEIGRKYGATVSGTGTGKKAKMPELPSPVLAVIKGETSKLGTIQKVIQNDKIKSAADAQTAGKKELGGIQETFTVSGPDNNLIRAGDKVKLGEMLLFVTSVKRDLGQPGHMDLQLAAESKVRRDYYRVTV